VGAWLVESFVWANARLKLDAQATVLTRDPDRFRSKCPEAAIDKAIHLLSGDVTSFKFPDGHFELVIHAATNKGEPYATFWPDIQGTQRVLEFAAKHGTKRILFTSSGAVYGKQPAEISHVPESYVGAPETTDERSGYGQAKRASEYLCALKGAVIARLFAFVGPYLPLDENYAVGNFIRDALAGEAIEIAGDGTPYRSYLYAADLAIWLWTLLVRGKTAQPYNVGSGAEINIADLARTVAATVKPGIPIRIAKQAAPGVAAARYVPSVELVEREFGLKPIITLEEGIRRTAKHAATRS